MAPDVEHAVPASADGGFVPSRLALARRRRGLTQAEVATASGLSLRSVVGYESGELQPSESAVASLATVLCFPTSFFALPAPAALEVEAVSFRALTRMRADRRARAIAGGQLALDLAAWIDERFSLPAAVLPDLRPASDPESAAMALRTEWALGDLPVSNMVRLLEVKGVRIFSLAEDTADVDAFSFWHGEAPFILLNTFKSAERSRFDAAHELGHLVLHRHGPPNGRQAEAEADAFASAFLMPRSSILAHVPRSAAPLLDHLVVLKRRWQVSVGALVHRLHGVGLLTDWQARQLWIQIQHRGYRTAEPKSIPREMSAVLEKVFTWARSQGWTKAHVARHLHWPMAELNALIFGLTLTGVAGGATGPAKERGPDPRLKLVE